MRIIAGEARGRVLEAPKGQGTRPTSDRVRESIFNILGQYFDGGRVLDLYAGSGAMGLETISRGAAQAVLVEEDRTAAALCAKNAAALGWGERVEVIRGDVLQTLRGLAARQERFDLIFADPPYQTGPGRALELLGTLEILAPGGRVVAEHHFRSPPDESYPGLLRTDLRKFGEPAVSFYEHRTSEPS